MNNIHISHSSPNAHGLEQGKTYELYNEITDRTFRGQLCFNTTLKEEVLYGMCAGENCECIVPLLCIAPYNWVIKQQNNTLLGDKKVNTILRLENQANRISKNIEDHMHLGVRWGIVEDAHESCLKVKIYTKPPRGVRPLVVKSNTKMDTLKKGIWDTESVVQLIFKDLLSEMRELITEL